jgi:hypothetical protein
MVAPTSEIATHHATRLNTPIHNILWTASQLSVSQKALGTLPEDGNVMSKHVGATIHNTDQQQKTSIDELSLPWVFCGC